MRRLCTDNISIIITATTALLLLLAMIIGCEIPIWLLCCVIGLSTSMLLMSCECTSAHAVNSTIYDTPEKSNETVLRFPKTVVGKYGLEKTAFMIQKGVWRLGCFCF